MPRVVGIDVGTLSTDLCGLDDGHVFLTRSMATAEALAQPSSLLTLLESAGHLDLIAGPSGYGLPLTRARDMTAEDVALAALGADDEAGGIGGFRSLLRAFSASSLPVTLTPGVIHLPTVPEH